jgi:hypothetical protein
MTRDPIVEDLHKVREAYAKRFGNDLRAICADAQQKQGGEGHRVVPTAPRTAIKTQKRGESVA